jgi:hypothetical protein
MCQHLFFVYKYTNPETRQSQSKPQPQPAGLHWLAFSIITDNGLGMKMGRFAPDVRADPGVEDT